MHTPAYAPLCTYACLCFHLPMHTPAYAPLCTRCFMHALCTKTLCSFMHAYASSALYSLLCSAKHAALLHRTMRFVSASENLYTSMQRPRSIHFYAFTNYASLCIWQDLYTRSHSYAVTYLYSSMQPGHYTFLCPSMKNYASPQNPMQGADSVLHRSIGWKAWYSGQKYAFLYVSYTKLYTFMKMPNLLKNYPYIC